MIKSDAQLDRTLAQISAFKLNVEAEQNKADTPELMKKVVVDSLNGMIAKLEFEVKEYRELKNGIIRMPPIYRIPEIGPYLLRFRLALVMTQEELAQAAGVTRQTINKHEEQEYQAASTDLILRVMDALGLVQRLEVTHQALDIREPELALA